VQFNRWRDGVVEGRIVAEQKRSPVGYGIGQLVAEGEEDIPSGGIVIWVDQEIDVAARPQERRRIVPFSKRYAFQDGKADRSLVEGRADFPDPEEATLMFQFLVGQSALVSEPIGNGPGYSSNSRKFLKFNGIAAVLLAAQDGDQAGFLFGRQVRWRGGWHSGEAISMIAPEPGF
jgi:hypothetical protein